MKEFIHTRTTSNGYECYATDNPNWTIEFRIKDGHGRLLHWIPNRRRFAEYYFNYEGGKGNFAGGFEIPLYIIDFIEYLFRKHEQYIKQGVIV